MEVVKLKVPNHFAEDEWVKRLYMVVQIFEQMEDREKLATAEYIRSRFGRAS